MKLKFVPKINDTKQESNRLTNMLLNTVDEDEILATTEKQQQKSDRGA